MGCTISVDSETVIKLHTLEQKYNALSSRIAKLERIEYISGILEKIKEKEDSHNDFEKIKLEIQIIKQQLRILEEKS
jgi:hypothetical protein